jgi:hypothetical protein
VATTGMRAAAAPVLALLIAAVLVALARVGYWKQPPASERVIRFSTWALAAIFLLEALAAFTWSKGANPNGGCTGRSLW